LSVLAVLAVAASSSWAGVPCAGTSEVVAATDSAAVCDTVLIWAYVRDCYGEPLANRVVTFYTDIEEDVEYIGNPGITDGDGYTEAYIHVPYAEAEHDTVDDYYTYLSANCEGVALGGYFDIIFITSAWLTTPLWEIQLTNYGYSDILYSYKPRYLRVWPWDYDWVRHEKLSGEWAAAIYYDGIPTPPIAQGPNVGLPQCMWLERHFRYPYWTTNSNFRVVAPIRTWNRGELPLPYKDTGMSIIANAQVMIRIDYRIWDTRTAMGRHSTALNPPFLTWIPSDQCILQQEYTITNIWGTPLTNLEMCQMLHGHASDRAPGPFGDWEVYDPTAWTTPPGDAWGTYHYDITQGGRLRPTWPWPDPWWGWFDWDWVGFHSELPPSVGRSPFAWGLGDYVGHGVGKPARPGVHWDQEEDNLDGTMGINTVYPLIGIPGAPVIVVPGEEVAGAETWYLTPVLDAGMDISHDVLLTISNRPYGGWHWGWDWWFWYDFSWPYWDFPSVFWGPHPWGHPYYKLWIDLPWWWGCCCTWPPDPNDHWVGVSIPDVEVARGVEIEGVYFKTYAPDSGGVTLATFTPDSTVADTLQARYPWTDNSWYGFSLEGYVLPDSQMVVYLQMRDPDQAMAGKTIHVRMGDAQTGWAEYYYEGLICCAPGSAGIPKDREVSEFMLTQIYPNPFSTTTQIQYALPEAAQVSLAIYTISGQHVKTLVSEYQAPGTKVVRWDGTNESGAAVTGGIYFCKFTAGEFSADKKIVVAR
jgi:hypothetical protein